MGGGTRTVHKILSTLSFEFSSKRVIIDESAISQRRLKEENVTQQLISVGLTP